MRGVDRHTRRLCHVSAGRNAGVNAWGGLARCRDPDDTNRGYRNTRTIRWMAKMVDSETFQMSTDRPRKHSPPSEWRHKTVPTEPLSVANENYGSLLGRCRGIIDPARQWSCCPRSRLETDHESAAIGRGRPLPGHAGRNPSMVATPLSRGCCWCN